MKCGGVCGMTFLISGKIEAGVGCGSRWREQWELDPDLARYNRNLTHQPRFSFFIDTSSTLFTSDFFQLFPPQKENPSFKDVPSTIYVNNLSETLQSRSRAAHTSDPALSVCTHLISSSTIIWRIQPDAIYRIGISLLLIAILHPLIKLRHHHSF